MNITIKVNKKIDMKKILFIALIMSCFTMYSQDQELFTGVWSFNYDKSYALIDSQEGKEFLDGLSVSDKEFFKKRKELKKFSFSSEGVFEIRKGEDLVLVGSWELDNNWIHLSSKDGSSHVKYRIVLINNEELVVEVEDLNGRKAIFSKQVYSKL